MENIMSNLPILVPVIIIEFALMLISLIHVIRHDKYKFGSKIMWILIVVFIQIIGPLVYFVLGKEDD